MRRCWNTSAYAQECGFRASTLNLCRCILGINPLMPTLKPQSNGRLYSNTVIGSLAVDGCAVTSNHLVSEMTYNVSSGTLNTTIPYHTIPSDHHIAILLYDGPMLCGFNVAIKGLSARRLHQNLKYTAVNYTWEAQSPHLTYIYYAHLNTNVFNFTFTIRHIAFNLQYEQLVLHH